MIIKTQSGNAVNVANSTNAQCFKQKEEVDWRSWKPKRGEIYLINLENSGIGSEQKNIRPFAILSNNVGNAMGSILVGCSITSKDKTMPKIHVKVGKKEGLKLENSYIMVEHIRSVDKRRFFINNNYPMKVGELSSQKLKEVEESIMFELGFGSSNRLQI